MSIDSVADLRTFALVVDHGSLSRAARALRLTPNGVSRRLMRLEGQLGVRLLSRTTHGVTPTVEGIALHARCKRVLAELDEVESELGRAGRQAKGRVRIAVGAAALNERSLEHVRRALAEHPALSFELVVATEPLDVVRDQLDVLVRLGKLADSTLVVRRLGSFAWQLAAAPSYLASRGRPRTPADLEAHECLRFLSPAPQTHWTLLDSSGREERVPVSGRLASDDSRVLADATYAGLGVGVRPRSELRLAVAAGTLEVVLPEHTFGEARDVYALLAPGRARARRVEVALEVLARMLAEVIE